MLRSALALTTLMTGTAPLSSSAADDLQHVIYACERSVRLPVVYVNPAEGDSYMVALIDGELRPMRRVISASGARYHTVDDTQPYELWSKGDKAVVSYGRAEASKQLFEDCTVIPTGNQ